MDRHIEGVVLYVCNIRRWVKVHFRPRKATVNDLRENLASAVENLKRKLQTWRQNKKNNHFINAGVNVFSAQP